MAPTSCFTASTARFLRELKRHNDREWFGAHKDDYERDVRAPMVALVERLTEDLPAFAPDLVASPRVSLYRIYRDTRFSPDKSPFKTEIGAIFPCRGLGKHRGACLYFHIGPTGVLVAGGMYRPDPADLHLARAHVAAHFPRFRAVVEAPAFIRAVGKVNGEAFARMPRGFPPDHPAAAYLRFRQFLVEREYPVRFMTGPRFYRDLLSLFRRMAPLVGFLNEPLLDAASHVDPLLAALPSRR